MGGVKPMITDTQIESARYAHYEGAAGQHVAGKDDYEWRGVICIDTEEDKGLAYMTDEQLLDHLYYIVSGHGDDFIATHITRNPKTKRRQIRVTLPVRGTGRDHEEAYDDATSEIISMSGTGGFRWFDVEEMV